MQRYDELYDRPGRRYPSPRRRLAQRPYPERRNPERATRVPRRANYGEEFGYDDDFRRARRYDAGRYGAGGYDVEGPGAGRYSDDYGEVRPMGAVPVEQERMGMRDFSEGYGRYSGGSPYSYEYSERTIYHRPRFTGAIGFSRPLGRERPRRWRR